jgi:hypothetical protein
VGSDSSSTGRGSACAWAPAVPAGWLAMTAGGSVAVGPAVSAGWGGGAPVVAQAAKSSVAGASQHGLTVSQADLLNVSHSECNEVRPLRLLPC